MRIVLDTNAFYTFIGEETLNIPTRNHKIKRNAFETLISNPNNEIAISSVTIYEFLVKFRDDIQVIRDVLLFINNNIEKIYIDPTLPFDVDDLHELIILPDSSLSAKICGYMEKKIDVEASFSSFFLGILVAQYTETYLKTNSDIQTQQVFMVYQQRFPIHVRATKDAFVLALRNGYAQQDAEVVVKNQFNEIIYEFLVSWVSFLELVKVHPDPEITENELHERFEKLNRENPNLKKIHNKKNDRDNNSLNAWIAKFCRDFSSGNDQQFVSMYKAALKNKRIQIIQIDYMEWIMFKMGQKGAKFKKNDILDMLIAIVLKDIDTVLISFDENMQDFIVSIGHISKSYIEQVYDRQL